MFKNPPIASPINLIDLAFNLRDEIQGKEHQKNIKIQEKEEKKNIREKIKEIEKVNKNWMKMKKYESRRISWLNIDDISTQNKNILKELRRIFIKYGHKIEKNYKDKINNLFDILEKNI